MWVLVLALLVGGAVRDGVGEIGIALLWGARRMGR